jgi:hypothetical protein
MYLCFQDIFSILNEGFVHSTITRNTGKNNYATALIFNDTNHAASLLLISQYPFFALQKDCLTKILAAVKNGNTYTVEFYISLLFHHLTFNPKLKNYVEVGSFDLLEGKSRTLFRYHNCEEDCLSLSNHPTKQMLELINLNNLFKLLSLILLEKKIVFVKKDNRDLAVIIEWLLSLIFPLY